MRPFPLIVTGRLILREFQDSDIQPVYEIFSHPQVCEFTEAEPFQTPDQAVQFVRTQIAQQNQSESADYLWAIAPAGSPETYLGSCGYHNADPLNRSLGIRYDLNPDYWGAGYASEAVHAMLRSLFSPGFNFPVNRVTAVTALDGRRSIRLLNRLGFTEEGVLRQFGFWKDRYQDVRLFSLLRKDWENPRYPAR